MIEVLHMPQGSAEWYAARLGIPTASEFAAVLAKGQGKVRRSYLMRLAAERLLGEVQDRYTGPHMQRGREMEAEAREAYSFVTGVEPELVGFVRRGAAGCSPDALIGEDGVLEIKTRLPALMVDVLETGGIPSEYRAQIQGALWITERSWCDLVCYWPGMPLHIARSTRDEDYIAALAEEVDRFVGELEAVVQRIAVGPNQILREQLERSAAL